MQKLISLLNSPRTASKLGAANLLCMTVTGAAGGHNYDWSDVRKDRLFKGQFYQTVVALGFFGAAQMSPLKFHPAVISALLVSDFCFVLPFYHMAFTCLARLLSINHCIHQLTESHAVRNSMVDTFIINRCLYSK